MPPLPLKYHGHELAGQFLAAAAFRPARTGRLRLTRANGQPAFGFYACDPDADRFYTVGLMVLTLSDTRISSMTRLDPLPSPSSVFPPASRTERSHRIRTNDPG